MKLNHDKPLSNIAFNFNPRPSDEGEEAMAVRTEIAAEMTALGKGGAVATQASQVYNW